MRKSLYIDDKYLFKSLVLGIILFQIIQIYAVEERVRIYDLNGKWKFTIGDNPEWASPTYNDQDWDEIYVPTPWENQGFHGYDGYAWYRTTVYIDDMYKSINLYLHLGCIDDVDEVFVNGHKIGFSGSFPPSYWTAYNSWRKYTIPQSSINGNEIVIAVRVYDAQGTGGIVKGDIGIFCDKFPFPLELDLQGVWRIKFGDHESYMKMNFDHSSWKEILVPLAWEHAGYRKDGFAWYRKEFYIDKQFQKTPIVLLLGYIDDNDEVYLNGKRVSNVYERPYHPYKINSEYNVYDLRAYYISGDLLKANSTNVIAIRVYDARSYGGIYKGPIGITTQKQFVRYWRKKNGKNY